MQRIHNLQQVEALFAKSNDVPVLIFKHSTACGGSADAWDELERLTKRQEANGVAIAYLHVIEDRPVSDAIAERTGVPHESPQVILIKNEVVAWSTSHRGITTDALLNALP